MQMEMGKRRLLLERGFRERTLELQARMEEAEVKRLEAEEQKSVAIILRIFFPGS